MNLKKIKNNAFKLLTQLLIFVDLFRPYLLVLGFVFLWIEAYTYPGFMSNIMVINAKIFAFLMVILNILIFLFELNHKLKKEYSPQLGLVFSINKLLVPVWFFLWFLFSYEEKSHFPNYVFSTFHLHPHYLKVIVTYSVSILLYEAMNCYKDLLLSIFKIRVKFEVLVSLIIFIVFSFISFQTFISVVNGFVINCVYFVQHPYLSYEDKMSIVVPTYQYYQFVKENTPDDAIIALPPQKNPWLTIGNIGYTRYFLYPRKLIADPDQMVIPKEAEYAVITRGEWASPDGKYGWPRATTSGQVIWFYDLENEKGEKTEEQVFDLTTHPELMYKWGLIKLK